MQVTELTAQWRSLNLDLRAHSDLLEQTRQELNQVEAEHASSMTQWDAQKCALNTAITEGGAHVDEAGTRAASIQAAADAKMIKMKDRASRNAQHAESLRYEWQTISARQNAAHKEDEKLRERLE